MLELLRYYLFKPLWEVLFIRFSMPLRVVLGIIFLCLLVWIIIRLKNVWKELFRFFLEILLLPEYFLSKNKTNVPWWLKYGDFLNATASFTIPLKENQDSKHIKFYWLGYPVLFLLIIFFPLLSCREKIKISVPSIEFIDKTYLIWTGFETWIISGDWEEPSDYYFDFVSHKVDKNETLESICSSYNTNDDINTMLNATMLMNKLEYPAIVKENIEQGWNLIIPVKKSLKVNFDNNITQSPQGVYRVKTRNKSGLNIRSAKDLKSDLVTFVPENGEVTVIYFDNQYVIVDGKRGKWCWVRAKDGKEGWAWGWYLTDVY